MQFSERVLHLNPKYHNLLLIIILNALLNELKIFFKNLFLIPFNLFCFNDFCFKISVLCILYRVKKNFWQQCLLINLAFLSIVVFSKKPYSTVKVSLLRKILKMKFTCCTKSPHFFSKQFCGVFNCCKFQTFLNSTCISKYQISYILSTVHHRIEKNK